MHVTKYSGQRKNSPYYIVYSQGTQFGFTRAQKGKTPFTTCIANEFKCMSQG